MKNKLTAEQWLARKVVTPLSNIVIRGIAHKSAAVHGEGKFNVIRAPRHISHRRGDGLVDTIVRRKTLLPTQHERVVAGRA